jgi:hypothetical protein
MAFVAQRLGADAVGAYTFIAARNLLGAAALLPLLWWSDRRDARDRGGASRRLAGGRRRPAMVIGVAAVRRLGAAAGRHRAHHRGQRRLRHRALHGDGAAGRSAVSARDAVGDVGGDRAGCARAVPAHLDRNRHRAG